MFPADRNIFFPHEHDACMRETMRLAEKACADRNLRLTRTRRRVLEILLENHQAIRAYDLLDRLGREGFGNQAPVAYRALDFWQSAGLAHRIRGMSAFVACAFPGACRDPALIICRKCRKVAERQLEAAYGAICERARLEGFAIERAIVEIEGVCAACREEQGGCA